MTAKDQFINNKPLAEWWAAIAGDTRFDSVLLHAAAVALETCPSSEQREGVIFLKEILLTIAQKEAPVVEFAKPGLNHNLEIKRRTNEEPEQDKK
jgi:hypothetical protein